MSGGSGPMVTDHTPLSPFVIGCGLPSSSPFAVTLFAFGASEAEGDAPIGASPPATRPAAAPGWRARTQTIATRRSKDVSRSFMDAHYRNSSGATSCR